MEKMSENRSAPSNKTHASLVNSLNQMAISTNKITSTSNKTDGSAMSSNSKSGNTSTSKFVSSNNILSANALPLDSATKKDTTSQSKKKSPKKKFHFEMDEKTMSVLKNVRYELRGQLGMGAFSEVFKAYSGKRDVQCAVKIINLKAMSANFYTRFLPRELGNLSNIRHPQIIRVYDIFRIRSNIFIFMEFAEKGDLTNYLKKHHTPLEEQHACKWFYQIMLALEYLHNEMKIAHRDIKIDNILIMEDNSVKLTDFGFSIQVNCDGSSVKMSTTFCGTRPYLAPQILLKKPYNPFKADIWAMGIVLFAMLNNRYPFHYKDYKLMIREQFDKAYIVSRFIARISSEAKNLMIRLLEVQEELRVEIMEIFRHEWVVSTYSKDYQIVLTFDASETK